MERALKRRSWFGRRPWQFQRAGRRMDGTLYMRRSIPGTGADLLALPIEGDRHPMVLAQTRLLKTRGRFRRMVIGSRTRRMNPARAKFMSFPSRLRRMGADGWCRVAAE